MRVVLKRRNYPWLDKVQHAEHMFINKEALGPIIICLSVVSNNTRVEWDQVLI